MLFFSVYGINKAPVITGIISSILIHLLLLFLLRVAIDNSFTKQSIQSTSRVLSLTIVNHPPVDIQKTVMVVQSRVKERQGRNPKDKINKKVVRKPKQLLTQRYIKNKVSIPEKAHNIFSEKEEKDIEFLLNPSPIAVNKKVQVKRHATAIASSKHQIVHSRLNFLKEKQVQDKRPVRKRKAITSRNKVNSSQSVKDAVNYKSQLRQLISMSKVYPARAKRRKQEGLVKVSFIISAKGVISHIKIVESSGSNILDEAAKTAILKVSGKLPFPQHIHKTQWSMFLPIRYQLKQ